MPAHVRDEVAGHFGIDRHHIIKIAAGFMKRRIMNRERRPRTFIRPDQYRLLRISELAQLRTLQFRRSAIVFADPEMDSHPGQHFFAIYRLGDIVDAADLQSLTLLFTSSSAERKMIGMSAVAGSSFSEAQVSKPDSPGITTSRRIRSGRQLWARARPVAPSHAICVMKPSAASRLLTKSALSCESSIIRIVGG